MPSGCKLRRARPAGAGVKRNDRSAVYGELTQHAPGNIEVERPGRRPVHSEVAAPLDRVCELVSSRHAGPDEIEPFLVEEMQRQIRVRVGAEGEPLVEARERFAAIVEALLERGRPRIVCVVARGKPAVDQHRPEHDLDDGEDDDDAGARQTARGGPAPPDEGERSRVDPRQWDAVEPTPSMGWPEDEGAPDDRCCESCAHATGCRSSLQRAPRSPSRTPRLSGSW